MDASPQSRPNLSRRGALTGASSVHRPPWTDEARVRKNCTSCGDCIDACPEAIVIKGPAGTPAIDFTRGACTFCAACASACGEGVFRDISQAPWDLTVQITPSCFLKLGISCQSCTDACDEQALRFDMRAGVVGEIVLSAEACTGCGACLPVCPASAIEIHQPKRQAA
jgi:ferredoxin-type protein NapF